MSLCWAQEAQMRPEASSIVSVTQPPLFPLPSVETPSSSLRWRQARLPMTVETGLGKIHRILRVSAVEVVTCTAVGELLVSSFFLMSTHLLALFLGFS